MLLRVVLRSDANLVGGQTMSFEEKQKVDRYRAFYYAAASGDFNPLHIDPAVGEKAGFGGPILHGLCTAAWMVDSVTRAHGDPRKINDGPRFPDLFVLVTN